MSEKPTGRGGKRENQTGRPKKPESEKQKRREYYLTDEENILAKYFIQMVKTSPEKAFGLMEKLKHEFREPE